MEPTPEKIAQKWKESSGVLVTLLGAKNMHKHVTLWAFQLHEPVTTTLPSPILLKVCLS